jgi:hypothetical protein
MVYDHAGDALLLFSVETVHAVTDFYQRTHVVSALVTAIGMQDGQMPTGAYLVTTNVFPPRGDCPVDRIVVC